MVAERPEIDNLISQFVAKAMELGLDSVTVGFTYREQGLTIGRVTGAGNFYARIAQMAEYIERDRENTREDVRHED